ncbi:aminotransferase class V-fold PLP-dependent enzyme [Synechococcus sp. PCC 7336]|uniref:aminotransferase class V-fold PLP-dependent enzyme n=1 Tax=Synechococcus sp. PCC 7336 TaxID=195250 RepID=UPI000345E5B6|nr:aminotransferase class V-fold PLP-dependent enzyme [Synechococcus sp. PCC 7336]
MPLDWQRARRETPGCDRVLHFNNAGAALMPAPVLDATIAHLQLEAEMGGYEAAALACERVERVYTATAELLGCEPGELAIVENATRAWDMAFYSLNFQAGDRILTAASEYASNYIAFLQVAKRTGATIEVIPNDETGQLSVSALERAIGDRVKLIAITHVPSNGGLVNPAAAVGRVARAAGIPYLLDACQSIGQMPVNVREIGCDFLSATGRKYLRGPRGTGFLYVRQALIEQLEPPFLDMHAAEWVERDRYRIRPDARRFETWEANYAAKIGLGVAIGYTLSWGLEAIRDRIRQLADRLRLQLAAIPSVAVRDLGRIQSGIVAFNSDRLSASQIATALNARDINVSISSLSSTRLDMESRQQIEFVRASVHYYNTVEEVDRFCDSLQQVLAGG